MNLISVNPGQVRGLGDREKEQLSELFTVFNNHIMKNAKKAKYYEGHINLSDVNLGIALPNGLRNLSVGCEWGAKCVDILAARSMFDGFVADDGTNAENLHKIMSDNRLLSEYSKACRDELKYGCTFATLSADDVIGVRIRFHSPQTAAAVWNGEKGRIDCGFAIIDTEPDELDANVWIPSHINLYTDSDVWEIKHSLGGWSAIRHPHQMGRPLMEPLVWNGTSSKPFGRSRIKSSIRALIDDYVRIMVNATIALEFDTTPQKYLLGITDEQYEATLNNKFKTYAGSLLLATQNPETGENPNFGQLTQGSLTPHIDKLRMTATQFSAATGLTVTDVGIINDANPTSSDAILAQSQTLVLLAEQLNAGNGDALRIIGMMAEAIVRNVPISSLTDEEKAIIPHFKNPAMPSVAVTADAAIKISSVRPEFASTDVYLEMIGFDQADIRRIKSQEQRARGSAVLTEEFDENIGE